jgi:sugar-specific transcriptional regulator TrmB
VAVDLLQRVGLNKYEAEAYLALMVEGPLTGYELGKRSGVPLSRSYEVLERLARRGLALIQPGDPPRYLAEAPERFLAHTRADQEALLRDLAAALAELPRAVPADDFWVVRGRPNILRRARALIDEARRALLVGHVGGDELSDPIADARARGCRVTVRRLDSLTEPPGQPVRAEPIVVLADDREALVGALGPAEQCQAVVSTNPALVLTVRGAGAGWEAAPIRLAEPSGPDDARRLDWLAWEDRKHRRLRRTGAA